MTAIPWTILAIIVGPAPFISLYRLVLRQRALGTGRFKNPRKIPLASIICVLLLLVTFWIIIANSFLIPWVIGKNENIFKATGSRLEVPVDVLATRLAAMKLLYTENKILLNKFENSNAQRLLYTIFGPKPLVYCTWCETGGALYGIDRTDYIFYAIPQIGLSHIIHTVVLGLATIPVSHYPFRWYAIAGAGLFFIWEAYTLASYDLSRNAAALRLDHIDWLFERIENVRASVFCLADLLLATCIYCNETGFLTILNPSVGTRVAFLNNELLKQLVKTRQLRVLNSMTKVNRDTRKPLDELRAARHYRDEKSRKTGIEEARRAAEERLESSGVHVRREARAFAETFKDI